MTIIQSIILGIVQGLTEFLPISSSGHLVILPYLLNWDIPPRDAFIFDVLVQVATMIAVIAYFWSDLLSIGRAMIFGLMGKSPLESTEARLGWYILLASIPAGGFGLILKDTVERAFASLTATAAALLLTAGLLVLAERIGKRTRSLDNATWKDALWIGFFQVLAIFPGVSRSGATISGGMIRNLDRPSAARFSFLMSVPIMLAAGALAILDLMQVPNLMSLLPVYIPGFISAAVVGYLAIRWLIRYLGTHSLYIFAIYCTIVGLISLGLSLFVY
jgi:undecaprenyl-diphosphatase